MSASAPEFTDSYPFKMDAKGRVTIPSQWRPDDELSVRMQRSLCYGVPTFRVLTVEELESMKATISDMDWTPERKRNRLGRLLSRTKSGSISKAGKLQVPKGVVDTMKFEPGGEIHLVGRGSYFEIYTPENYRKMVAAEDADEADESGILIL